MDFAEARYYNNRHARFTAVDPLLASGKSANPQTFNRYVYCLNNPLVFFDPNGEFPISIVVRAFAPFAWFGPGRFHKGDNRGFTTDLNASYRIRARTDYNTETKKGTTYSFGSWSEAHYNCALGMISCRIQRGFSQGYVRTPKLGELGNDVNVGNYRQVEENGKISYHLFGNVSVVIPEVRGRYTSPSWDIDIHTGLTISTKENGNNHLLNITGEIRGDQFPSAEALVNDINGVAVYLGVFSIPDVEIAGVGTKEFTGPTMQLAGDRNLGMINVNVTIVANKQGAFLGVMQGDRMISIDEWNRQFQNQPAVTK